MCVALFGVVACLAGVDEKGEVANTLGLSSVAEWDSPNGENERTTTEEGGSNSREESQTNEMVSIHKS